MPWLRTWPSSSVSTDNAELEPLRRRIDEIDRQLIALLNERAQCALDVGHIKQAKGGDGAFFYRPERVAQILDKLEALNTGPLSNTDLAHLYREILSCCLNLEQPVSVAYLGPAGTYTQAATIKQFGHFARIRPLTSIDEVFREVESGAMNYGVVPVENSTEGMVNHTLDCFISSTLKVCAEVELPIHQCLMQRPDEEGFDEILSHAQSLAQCRSWLDQHHPGIPRTVVSSNGEAARLAGERRGKAAVAGEQAAELYGLKIIARNIEDRPDNKTRFLVIGQQDVGPSGSDKTSILVSTRNEPGALFRVLEPLQKHGISLTRIETRPARDGNWSYVFFIDFDGHETDSPVKAALDAVRSVAMSVRVLGSYPQARL
ncbi:MAG: prephenate dehydratase [Gammaproteobacteria bacterium]|nr:prephenate dehydratase [Gammaproteobacteria bacterium]